MLNIPYDEQWWASKIDIWNNTFLVYSTYDIIIMNVPCIDMMIWSSLRSS